MGDIRCKDDVFTHLYTLILDASEHSYEVLIDNESVEKGLLTDDWDMLPPKKIKDPEAKKPSQEEHDEREKIDDPEASKPEDWDDEMDGDWEPAMIDNPEYKGEWKPRQIDNPAYKGKWVHPEIDNPEYNADDAKDLGKYDEFCKVGLDLWQVKSGTIFDNFLITDDVEEAKKIGDETWGVTKDAEKKMKDDQDEIERKKAEEEAKNATPEEEDDEDSDDLDDEDEVPADDGDDESEHHDEL